MTKPMCCPMSFSHEIDDFTRRCTPDCAWAVSNEESYGCAIVADATAYGYRANTRPLKDDAE